MFYPSLRRMPICLLPLVLSSTFAASAQTDVLTWHNDLARTGQNLREAILTPAKVNSATFGLRANVVVDGKVDAQPLYVSALQINGKRHNVLFVATEHDSLYAIEADTGSVLWKRTLLGAGETTSDNRNCNQVTPEIGITATPVIDRTAGTNGTIYVVAMSKSSNGTYFHRIHAIDLATAAEQPNSPVAVAATYPGTGDGSANGVVTFDPGQYKERPALLLSHGALYTSWGSHCDIRPYGGWVMTYNPQTLAQTSALDFVPNGSDAAPWNAGAGPAADPHGSVYISLGNGTFDSTLTASGFPAQGDYGNSLVKMYLYNGRLAPTDYWTMYNSNQESGQDTDLGSGGLLLLPDLLDSNGTTRHLLVAAGKDTNLYVADRDNMGHFNATSNASLYQELSGGLQGGIWSSPAYFNNHVYYGPVGHSLRSYGITNALLNASPVQTTSTTFTYPGTTPSISAFGSTNGIVWAPENTNPAVLHAYDASNLATEFYNSNQAAGSRDHFGAGDKFIAPTIANGKVFVGTTNSVGIFGILPTTAPPMPDGDYTITNNSSHLLLENPYSSTGPGTGMVQSAANGFVSEQWFFTWNGTGFYTIQSAASNLFLTDPGGSSTPGIALREYLPANDDTQLWSLTTTAKGTVIQNKATGLVFDDAGSKPNPGNGIILWTPLGALNQAWTIQ